MLAKRKDAAEALDSGATDAEGGEPESSRLGLAKNAEEKLLTHY